MRGYQSSLIFIDVCKWYASREGNDRQLAGASDDGDDNDDDGDDDSSGIAMHLRRDAFRQGPPFHGRLVLHVLDLFLQCVLVHGGEYTGIHGYSRTPLVAKSRTGWRVRLHWKINRNGLRLGMGCYACNASDGLEDERGGSAPRGREHPRSRHRNLPIAGVSFVKHDECKPI